MDFIDYFPSMQVINLPDRIDRRREMEAELARAGLNPSATHVEFFAAVRPSLDEARGWPSVGARGCFMSHLAILERALECDWPAVLVMEDDLTFHRSFAVHARALVRQLEAMPWGFAYFGHMVETAASNPAFRRCDDPLQTTHFYAVSRRILEPLVDYLRDVQRRPAGHPDGGPMHVDGAYNMFRAQHPEVLTVIATPSLGGQRSSASDVTPRWADQTPGLRRLIQNSRRLARWMKQAPQRTDA